MRLKPVAPILFLKSNEEYVAAWPFQKYPLMLLRCMADCRTVIFTDAKNFGRTPAQAEFSAQHFMLKAFVPFGAGPRFARRQLAMVEIKMVMAMLSGTFEVSRRSPQTVGEIFSFTMMPRIYLCVSSAQEITHGRVVRLPPHS
jgi:cytochrome P450